MISRLTGTMLNAVGLFKKKRERDVRLTGVNYTMARELLLFTAETLDRAGVTYHLEGGTLLGLVRDGDILPWDYDLDISVMSEDVPRLLRTLWRFPLRGYYVSRRYAHKAGPGWPEGALRIVKLRNRRWWFFKGDIRLDIVIKYNAGDSTCWTIVKKICEVERRFYEGFDEIAWQGRTLKTPRDRETYLVRKYGDWHVPQKDFINARDDQTIRGDL